MFFPFTPDQAFQLGQHLAWFLCEIGPALFQPCSGPVPFVPFPFP
ncbi:hypothetical protein [Lolliginicoccus suaedae]|nr:hypothetical protein [Lolliginicoccus suaedae]